MPAPRGVYTPSTGPLAGRSFSTYFQYQQARAQALGFTSYSEERRISSRPIFRHLENRLISVQGIGRYAARAMLAQQEFTRAPAEVRRFGYRGLDSYADRKRAAIAWAMDEGLYDDGRDAADDIPY